MGSKKNIWALAAVVLLAACSTPAKLGYLRDLDYNVPETVRPAPELRLKVDDRISIQVFSEELELAAPFNVAGLAVEGEAAALLSSTYGVDARGDIDFPILGEIHVEGKTLKEVQNEISAEIVRRGYIKEPVVKADLVNFNVYVLGEFGPTPIHVDGNSINLLQVLAQIMSNRTADAKIPDVMVIRTVEGERMAYSVNLQSKSLFDSPVFYLEQNDVVYIKPRGARLSSEGSAFLQVLSPVISSVSALAYMLLWTSR